MVRPIIFKGISLSSSSAFTCKSKSKFIFSSSAVLSLPDFKSSVLNSLNPSNPIALVNLITVGVLTLLFLAISSNPISSISYLFAKI